MGELYKSLARNQNLLPTVMNIREYLDKKKKEEALQAFLETMQSTMGGMKDVYADKTANPNRGVQPQGSLLPQLVDPKQNAVLKPDSEIPLLNEEPTAPVEVQKPQNFTDLRGTTPLGLQDKNKIANERLLGFMMNQLTNQDVPAETKQYGSGLLQQLIQNQQPMKRDIDAVNPEYDVIDKSTGEVIRSGKTKQDKKTANDFKVSEDGYYMYWDVKDGWVKTKEKAPKKESDQSLGWAKLMYDMQQDQQKEGQGKKDAQAKYNAIMGSEWVTMDELIKQGQITKDDPSVGNYGGAYVVRDEKGKDRLIFTDKQLEDFAKSQVSETPNKWDRENSDDNDPLGIR